MLTNRLPTEAQEKQDMAWLANLINTLKDGGTWAIPRSGTICTLNHETKTVSMSTDVEQLTEYYFKRLGWKVTHAKS